ncbi:MAG: glycoside hydrolase family 130 protein [Kiritimatiellae bacterium]|nr:glycoside hydrolase family 130 protein [Kiritimatiellia bacterium]
MERHPANPILTRADIPGVTPRLRDVTSVFNPGAARVGDEVHLMLRVQNRARETFFMAARSPDGVRFHVRPEPIRLDGLERIGGRIFHCYDARITPIDGAFYILFAMDMECGCRLGLARTLNFEQFEFLGVVSEEDNRNGVLFPEKVAGRYLRLDRPNRAALSGGPRSGTEIWLSESDDLMNWNPVGPVASGRFHYWDEFIGAGPPPLKTREGWLLLYHGIATHLSAGIYQAGALLLDLENPLRVLQRSPANILEPRESYECVGQVPNVVFPSGWVADRMDDRGFLQPDSRVLCYYGAADTCVGLATFTWSEWKSHAFPGWQIGDPM